MFPAFHSPACMQVSALPNLVKTTMLLLEPRLVMHLQTAVGAHPGNRLSSVYRGCDESKLINVTCLADCTH